MYTISYILLFLISLKDQIAIIPETTSHQASTDENMLFSTPKSLAIIVPHLLIEKPA